MGRTFILRAVSLGLAAGLSLTGGAHAALDPNDAVPVDVSIIDQGSGKGYTFQTTYATPFYTYDKDKPGVSNCAGKCAEVWIPVYPSQLNAADIPPTWQVIKRSDGEKQWAYHGRPIYTFGFGAHEPPTAKDTAGQWHVLTP